MAAETTTTLDGGASDAKTATAACGALVFLVGFLKGFPRFFKGLARDFLVFLKRFLRFLPGFCRVFLGLF